MDRLVSFVDLAPTLLSLIGLEAPEYMQGRAFLGKYQKDEPEYIYMFRDRMDGRYDMSRSMVDKNFRYTRNYNATRIYLQHLAYLWRAPSMRSWEEAFKSGQCNEVQSRWWSSKPVEELYDTENDPWEVNNLAKDPAYADKLGTMRKASLAMGASILDAGFIPEADRNIRAGSTPIYDYMRSDDVPYNEIIAAAMLASENDPANLDSFIELLDHDDSAVRFWAAQGLLLLGEKARPAIEMIQKAAFDESWNVSVTCAEILYQLGGKTNALEAYSRVLQCDEPMARTCALNSIDHINGSPEEFVAYCVSIIRDKYSTLNMGRDYDARLIQWLFKKWGIDPLEYGIDNL